MTIPGHPGATGIPGAHLFTATRAIPIALAVLVMAVSAQVAVPLPFTPVPFTLQPVAVLVIGALLGPRLGLAALVGYLLLGATGAPVFAMGRGGVAHLIGPTAGYLLAFPLAAYVAGLGGASRWLRMLPAMAVAMVVIHLGGASWLAILGRDPAFAFEVGLLPFLTGDLLKVGLAAALSLLLAPRLRPGR